MDTLADLMEEGSLWESQALQSPHDAMHAHTKLAEQLDFTAEGLQAGQVCDFFTAVLEAGRTKEPSQPFPNTNSSWTDSPW